MIEWRFKPNSRDDMDVDPIQGEFFTTRDTDNVAAIVREGVQNALDERNRESQSDAVKVRVFLSGKKYSLSPHDYMPLLKTLLPHLKSKTSGIPSLPDFNSPLLFMAFEDFNTKGLEGDPEEFYIEDSNDQKHHNFYYFWRNVGRSGKSDDKLGRWGLGKTVFPASSRINTFWGLTVRKSDQRKMLMGQSILRIHNRTDHMAQESGFKPYGMFGNYKSGDYFAEPIEKEEDILQFEELFRLSRGNNTGLSLIIPFINEEINIDRLAYAAIEQYFYPILDGKLDVEIAEEDKCIILNQATIIDSVSSLNYESLLGIDDRRYRSKDELLHLFDFAKWTLELQKEDFVILNTPNVGAKPRWTKAVFPDDNGMKALRDRFEKNGRIAFKVPLKCHPVNGLAKICWYDAFLEKDSSLTKPENIFVRDGITISGISSLEKGLIRGIVIIHDVDLARMFGDSENPAHTEWQPESRNFKGKYVDGKEALSFMKSTLKRIYDQLQRPIEGLQKDLLVDFFSIPIETMEDAREHDLPGVDNGEDDTILPEVPRMKGNPRPIKVEKIYSGIKISNNPFSIKTPENVQIKLGYDVRRGNPFSNYQELDFDVSKLPIHVQSSGVYFTKKEKNIIEFEIEDKLNFEIILTGFDINRDLLLKIK